MKKNIISAIVLSSMLLLAACSGSSNESATQAADAGAVSSEAAADQTTAAGESAGSAAAGELKLVEAGKLIVSTNAEFPPYEYYDANEIVGIDVEIAKAGYDRKRRFRDKVSGRFGRKEYRSSAWNYRRYNGNRCKGFQGRAIQQGNGCSSGTFSGENRCGYYR